MIHTPTWHELGHHHITEHTEHGHIISVCWNCYDTWTTKPL